MAVVTKGHVTAGIHNLFIISPAVRGEAVVGDARVLEVAAEIPKGTSEPVPDFSQNPSMVGAGRDPWGSPSPTPCPSRVTQSRLHSTAATRGWNISREGDSTASLGSLGQGSGTLRGKKFFLIPVAWPGGTVLQGRAKSSSARSGDGTFSEVVAAAALP